MLNPQGTVTKVLAVTNPYGQEIYTTAFHLSWWQPGAKPLPVQTVNTDRPANVEKPTTAFRPPTLELGRSYPLIIQDLEPWELRLEQKNGNKLEGITVATNQGDRAELETIWDPAMGLLELIEDEDRIRCVFRAMQNGVLSGDAVYSEEGQADRTLGWCKLNTQP